MTTEPDLKIDITATVKEPGAFPLLSLLAYLAHRNTLRRSGPLPSGVVRTFEEIILEHGREFAIDGGTFDISVAITVDGVTVLILFFCSEGHKAEWYEDGRIEQ